MQSEYLLHEAEKCGYTGDKPQKQSERMQGMDESVEEHVRVFVEWRKTFSKESESKIDNFFIGQGKFLDSFYCREVLRAVPGMVERTRALARLTLPGAEGSEWMTYLRESANCYISGLPQASVALARAAVECRLRAACSKMLGEDIVRRADFVDVINDLCRKAVLLDADTRSLAHKVRKAANEVLHNRPTDAPEALAVFEAARSVILGVRPS